MHDSWKTRILLYIRGKENGEMLIDSIENGHLQLKPKITAKDKDVDIYTLIGHYQTAKQIWDCVKELMEGTKMTEQKHESLQYDEFNKFTSEPVESIHSYYLRYAKLINDMNMIPMSLLNMQINTKFMNHLQPEWNSLGLLANTYNPTSSYNSQKLQYYSQPPEVYQLYQYYESTILVTQQFIQSPPKQSYAPPVAQQQPPKLPTQLDYGFVVPTFLPTDDPIASLNKAMIFLSFYYSSRYPPTNNQLRTSSNLRTQATIQNGQVTVQNVQGRQSQGYTGNAGKRHIAKQCTAKKRVKYSEWFKDKMMLAQAKEAGVVLHEEQQDFLADRLEENDDYDDLQLHTTTNFKADHVDAYDSNCDDQATASAIFMAKTKYTKHSVFLNDSYVELMSDSTVISYAEYMVTIEDEAAQNVPSSIQNDDMMLSAIEQIKSQVEQCTMESLILAEESQLKMTEKQTEINAKPIDYSKLNNLYEYFVPQKQLSAEQLYSKTFKMQEIFLVSLMTASKGELLYLLIRSVAGSNQT
ncbi:hypothetical protein Tco_1030249 [Tanacetum coccineum]|uniref:Integrase, catalytic region, zinc finger, CCHC-type, peptidase aspartic, catalytic n=1 Tax=Tanacetum coccineum TaxID=301880 RepID=A0ABQ5G5P5_9ASTR